MSAGAPQLDPTRSPISGVHRAVTPRPILASELLKQDLAPLEPSAWSCRLWLGGVAVALTLLGIAYKLGVGLAATRLGVGTSTLATAAAVTAVALLPFPYAARAGVAMAGGLLLMLLGINGAGPLQGLAVDGGSAAQLARVVALVVLPAALLFRARYAAYGRARWVLAGALALALPFVGLAVSVAVDPASGVVSRGASAVSVVSVICCLFGFMGAESSAGGSLWAALLLAVLPAELALRELTPLADADAGHLTYPATAIGLVCAAVLASIGAYQLLASALGPDARRAADQPESA